MSDSHEVGYKSWSQQTHLLRAVHLNESDSLYLSNVIFGAAFSLLVLPTSSLDVMMSFIGKWYSCLSAVEGN